MNHPVSESPAASATLNIVILGLSITSSWGNGHATTYRGLMCGLVRRGHRVLFLERDQPWYRKNRDLPHPPYGHTEIYADLTELKSRFSGEVRRADLVMVGSYVPEGIAVGEWVTTVAKGVTAFYDIDTPVTLARLEQGDLEYLSHRLIPRYRLYLSFTGGPMLKRLERQYGSPAARVLYCSVDPALYFPEESEGQWDFGYMGTYSPDRQLLLDRLLLEPARRWPGGRMVVVGPQYPENIRWPSNVERIVHLPPAGHRAFYNAQRCTLNVTRSDMLASGWSPSVRLFEASACATPIISDSWEGLESLFEPGREILIARSSEDVQGYLHEMPASDLRAIGARARQRVLSGHTSAHRAAELEAYAMDLLGKNEKNANHAK